MASMKRTHLHRTGDVERQKDLKFRYGLREEGEEPEHGKKKNS